MTRGELDRVFGIYGKIHSVSSLFVLETSREWSGILLAADRGTPFGGLRVCVMRILYLISIRQSPSLPSFVAATSHGGV